MTARLGHPLEPKQVSTDSLDLLLHVLEKALLAVANMLHGHAFRTTPQGLFLNAFLTRVLTKKGTRETACLASSVQSTMELHLRDFTEFLHQKEAVSLT